jgi:hypothetical protein
MGGIMQRGSALPGQINTDLPRHLTREVGRAIDQESARGVVQAHSAQVDAFVTDCKIRAGALVARTAMTCAAELSAYEEHLIRLAPLAEPRLNLLVNSWVAGTAGELANFGRPGWS